MYQSSFNNFSTNLTSLLTDMKEDLETAYSGNYRINDGLKYLSNIKTKISSDCNFQGEVMKLEQARDKEIEEVERGKFKAIINTEYHSGILDLTPKGSGYIICDDFEDDVFITSNNINKALNGDEVEFYFLSFKFFVIILIS